MASERGRDASIVASRERIMVSIATGPDHGQGPSPQNSLGHEQKEKKVSESGKRPQGVYPTEQASRQKVAKQVLKDEMASQGKTPEEIKELLKRKAQIQERHYDDCGSDVEMIQDTEGRSELAMYGTTLEDAVAYSFEVDKIEDEWETDILNNSALSYMLSSEVTDDNPAWQYENQTATVIASEYLASWVKHHAGFPMIMEIFGGAAGVTKMALRFKLQNGGNYDLVTGWDLTQPTQQHEMLKQIGQMQPMMIVMGPPCTSFGSLAAINKQRHPVTWEKQRKVGEELAKITAHICAAQSSSGKYFVVENPKGSELFQLPCMRRLQQSGKCGEISFPQCALGLMNPEQDQPLLKWTTIWSNSIQVLRQFEGLQCVHTSHGVITGVYKGRSRSSWAQVWPVQMCRKILLGTCSCIHAATNRTEIRHRQDVLWATSPAYPELEIAAGPGPERKKRGRPPTLPGGFRQSEMDYGCPGCKKRKPWTDESHTRQGQPPQMCKYEKEPEYTCEGCVKSRPPDHRSHTREAGNCRQPAKRETGVRRARGPTRDPSVKAATNMAGTKLLSDDLDDDKDQGTSQGPGIIETRRPATEVASGSGLTRLAGQDSDGAISRDGVATETQGVPGATTPEVSDSEDDKVAGPATNRERREANADRVKRASRVDSSNQSDQSAANDWRTLDIGKAMSSLASVVPDVRRKALMRLHVRWWHASTEALSRTLKAAGAPAAAIADIPAMVQGCRVCRDWKRPGPTNVATIRMVENFNEEVQFDLMFYESLIDKKRGRLPIIHLIDACIRWSTTAIVASREEEELTMGISRAWISTFGSMTTLVQDGETGMRGQLALDWALANAITLKFKAPRQKAWLVERGNEILRQALHKTETQLLQEDLTSISVECTLAMVTFMKNSLTVIGTSTPYQALLGRQPLILPPQEGGTTAQQNGGTAVECNRGFTDGKHQARVREIAAINIIEANAKSRLDRASNSNTRAALELTDFSVGDVVDIWFEPVHKDMRGWRGPAEILSVHAAEGNVNVRMQGRTLSRRAQEVRPHIPYFPVMMALQSEQMDDWYVLKKQCEDLKEGTVKTYGMILLDAGWHLTKVSLYVQGANILQAALRLAATSMFVHNCTTCRMWKGVSYIESILGFDHSEIIMWWPGSEDQPDNLTSEPGDLIAKVSAKDLAQAFEQVTKDGQRWQEVCFIQLMGVSDQDVPDVIRTEPNMPNLAGAGHYRPRSMWETPQRPARDEVQNEDPGKKRRVQGTGEEDDDDMPPPPPPDGPGSKPGTRRNQWRAHPYEGDPKNVPENTARGSGDPPPPPDAGGARCEAETRDMDWRKWYRERTPPPSAVSDGGRSRSPPSAKDKVRSLIQHMIPTGTPPGLQSPASHEFRTPENHVGEDNDDYASTIPYSSPQSMASTIPYPETEDKKRQLTPSPNQPHKMPKVAHDEKAVELPIKEAEDVEEDNVELVLASLVEDNSCWHMGESRREQPTAEVLAVLQSPKFAGVVEIAVEGRLAQTHDWADSLPAGHEIVYEVTAAASPSVALRIELSTGNLTKEEILKNLPSVKVSKLKEIKGLLDLGTFARRARKESKNLVDTRWVLTWKQIEGVRSVKARLTMRGFKDMQQDLETFAGTTSRAGQRLVNTIVAQNANMVLFSFDVSQAFAKGMTFEEYAKLTGTTLRRVQFSLHPDDVCILRMLEGYSDFDPSTEVLDMIKPIYGLKDAPRAWRKRLHQALTKFGLRPLIAEPEVYVMHKYRKQPDSAPKSVKSVSEWIDREQRVAKELEPKALSHDSEEDETPTLEMIISTHVDDIKGGATKAMADSLLAFLNKEFGSCTNEWSKFTHTGVEHEQTGEGIFCHQWKYAESLKQLVLTKYYKHDDGELVDEETHAAYSSLLGGVAWLALTRADAAIYIQALQRHASKPRLKDCRGLNTVTRFVQKNKLGIWYGRIPSSQYRLLGFTDAAFKAQEGESTGLALRGLAILLTEDPIKMGPRTGMRATTANQEEKVHLLDWLVRRLKRVVRSTFAAELNALIDTIETLLLLQLAMHQVLKGTYDTEQSLLDKMEHGQLHPPIDLMVDAKSVTDAVSAQDVCTPQECSLKLHLIAIRDRLQRGLLRSVSWTDTRDMIADALTKGAVERETIQRAMKGLLHMKSEVKTTWGKGISVCNV